MNDNIREGYNNEVGDEVGHIKKVIWRFEPSILCLNMCYDLLVPHINKKQVAEFY